MFTSKSLTEPQKAYLAGFIDGEGYIGLTFQIKRETFQNSATPRYHPYLIIANNNSPVLFYVKDIIGEGRIYRQKRNIERQKPGFQYKLTKMEVLEKLLAAIEPYLVVKRQQAKLLLKYLNTRRSKKVTTGAGSRGSTSFSREEEQIHQELLRVNKKGLG